MLMEFWNGMTPVFIGRILLAGLLGAAIGFEREYRGKEAGMRTHFLVSLGSALIMVTSQWGFSDVLGMKNIGLDPSRVAAQVVSGIGFIGAGTIMMHKQSVSGLTTAAGLWVASGIGLAIGGGLYILGVVSTILVLMGFEILQYFTRNFKTKCSALVFLTRDKNDLIRITNELNNGEFHIVSYSVDPLKSDPEKLRVQIRVRTREHGGENQLVLFMQQFPEVTVEKIE